MSCKSTLAFIQIVVVVCYMFLLVYTWVFLGDRIIVEIPFTTKKVCVLAPYTDIKWLGGVYLILLITSFIVWIVGSYMLQLSKFCRVTSPLLYSFTLFTVAFYWLGFIIVVIMLFKMKYGQQLIDAVAEQLKEPTEAELEEKIFRKKFNEYDKDKVGTLPRESLPAFLQDLGVYVPDEEMPGLLEKLDSKGDGKIVFNKLQAWFKQVNAQASGLPAELDKSKKSK